jgi:hypothetical protein
LLTAVRGGAKSRFVLLRRRSFVVVVLLTVVISFVGSGSSHKVMEGFRLAPVTVV